MPFSLDDYAFMRVIYDLNPNRTVTLQTGRQVSKSSMLANITVANSCLLPRDPLRPGPHPRGFRSLYVSPSVDQTKVFSYDRLSPVIEESPFIKKYYYNRALRNNVFNKTLQNSASIYLRYALLSADRLRGQSQDSIAFDEVQDMLPDVMEIIRQSMFTSKYKWQWIVGTPKRRQGTLARSWDSSTQHEWAVKCGHCSKHNILVEQNIGKKGLVCRYCDGIMDPRIGEWVCTNASALDREDQNVGFRVSQLQFANAPFINWGQDVLHKYENESRATFYNEVLGLAYDDGVATITIEEIKACCKDHPNGTRRGAVRPCFMGIDWGPANSNHSHTLCVIMSVNEFHVPVVHYMRRFEGQEANFEYLHELIPEIAHKWNVKLIGADRGMGEASNAELRRRLGFNKVFEFQHSATLKQKHPQWNKKGMFYVTNRNHEIGEVFNRIKKRTIEFPSFRTIEKPYCADMLALTADYDEKHNKMSYINSDPDDTLHALIYGMLAARISGEFSSEVVW